MQPSPFLTMPCCPLSGSPDVTLVERLDVHDIVTLFRTRMKVEIGNEFKGLTTIDYYKSNATGLYFFDPLITGSEGFYEQLQKQSFYYPDERGEFQYAARLVKAHQKVLEIGCGKGVFADFIPSATYIGLEFNASAVQRARARGLTVLKESIEHHATTHNGAYDIVCAFQVLEHVSDIVGFITSSIAALRPGGLIIYTVPNTDSFLRWSVNNILAVPPHHVTMWTDQALRAVARLFSLKIIDIRCEALSPNHRGAFLQAMINRSYAIATHQKPRLLNTSLSYRLVDRMLFRLCRQFALFMLPPCDTLIGHSLYAVYQKP
jgi:SAM-dependent methyltransferase